MVRNRLLSLALVALIVALCVTPASAGTEYFTLEILNSSGDPTADSATILLSSPGGDIPYGMYYYYPGRTVAIRLTPVGSGLPPEETGYTISADFTSLGASAPVAGAWSATDGYWSIEYDIPDSFEPDPEDPACQIEVTMQIVMPPQDVTVAMITAVVGINPSDSDAGLQGDTTDWESVTDFTYATNLTFDKYNGSTHVGKLVLHGPINLCDMDASGVPITAMALIDLADNMEIAAGEMSIDTAAGALAAFDGPSSLAMYNLPFNDAPGIIYRDNDGNAQTLIQPGSDTDLTGTISNFDWDGENDCVSFDVYGWSEYDTFIKVGATASDASVSMASGNTSVSASDNTWTLTLTNGTVSSDVYADDLAVTGLPAGLSVTAEKGAGDTIEVTVGGTATTPVEEETEVSIVVKGSAVDEADAADSAAVIVSVNPFAPSSDASLSALTLSRGTLTPAFASDVTEYTASTSASSLSVTATVYDTGATMTVDGSTQASGVAKTVDLAIGENTIEIEVTAEDGTTTETYTVTVTRTSGGGGGSGSGSSSSTTPEPSIDGTRADVSAGAQTTTQSNSDGTTTTTVTLSTDVIEKALASGSEVTEVVVELKHGTEEQAAVLSADALAKMADSGAALVIETPAASLSIPAQVIDIAGIAEALGAKAGDVQFKVSVKEVPAAAGEALQRKAADGDPALNPVTKTLEFTIEASVGDKKVTVRAFTSPVQGEFPYTSEDVEDVDDLRRLNVYRFDEATQQWMPVRSVVDTSRSTVIFYTTHFSNFTIMEYRKTFADIVDHWAREDVELMASKYVVTGVSGDAFSPDGEVTRAQFSAMLVRALGLTLPGDPEPGFVDVQPGEWYSGYVEAAAKAGLVNGYEDGTFRAGQRISRQEMAVMLVRALKAAGADIALTGEEEAAVIGDFDDAASITTWARDGVAKTVKAGIMKGSGPSRFAPSADATRAQSATVIRRLMEKAGML